MSGTNGRVARGKPLFNESPNNSFLSLPHVGETANVWKTELLSDWTKYIFLYSILWKI